MNVTSLLANKVEKIGLRINDDITKIMEMFKSDEDFRELEQLTYKKVDDFKYLGATLSMKNEWVKELHQDK